VLQYVLPALLVFQHVLLRDETLERMRLLQGSVDLTDSLVFVQVGLFELESENAHMNVGHADAYSFLP